MAVCVHPQDVRYKERIGQQVIVPYIGRPIPVIADEAVDPNFGTGVLKITPAHDHLDYEIGKRHQLALLNIMNKDATMNENCGGFQGLDRMECRRQLWQWMESQGLVLKEEPYRIRVPRSQRSGEVVEPLVSLQWFVRTATLALPAMKAIQSGEIRMIPSRFEKIYLRWMENIHDWCISRQLWWGHSLPVWYIENIQTDSIQESFVVAHSEREAMEKLKAKYPNLDENIRLRRETDVLDTWFSSGLWPFALLGWPNTETLDYQMFYPNSVMETGYDILFFWIARMIMLGYELTGKPPFHIVYLHGLVRDDKGQKMSKTLGNVLDPLQIMADYGTDALRLTLATSCYAGQDISFSLDKVAANRNFANKLWNIGRFIIQNIRQRDIQSEWIIAYHQELVQSPIHCLAALGLAEKFIIHKLYQLIVQVNHQIQEFDLANAGNRLVDFIWDDFADWYIEIAKTRWQEKVFPGIQIAALLIYVWDYCLRLLHPFMPFITEAQWQWLVHQCDLPKPTNALIIAEWPQIDESFFATFSKEAEKHISRFESFREIVRTIRKIRADYGIAPSQKVKAVIHLKEDAKDLMVALKQEWNALKVLAKTEDNLVIEMNNSVFATNSHLVEGNADALEYRDGFIYVLVSPVIMIAVGLRGSIDASKELERLTKQEKKLQKEIELLSGRLDNPKFLENAPPKVVDESKQSLEQCQQQRKTVLAQRNIFRILAMETETQ